MIEKKWSATYNQDDNSELRELQLVLLENIKVFVDICEKYNLRYFMIGGTMLGAVRHQGFIPWDDDVDMGMPRDDYEKFLEVVSKELPNGYSFLNYKYSDEYKRYFSRIVNDNVRIYNESNSKKIIENAWIDIFPFDGMPKNWLVQKLHFYRMVWLRFLFHASCFEELVNLNRPGRPRYQQVAIKFLKYTKFGSNLDTKKILNKLEKQLKKYQYKDSDIVVNFFGAYMEKEIIPKKLIDNLKYYHFEDSRFLGAENYDEYLKYFYGDYMKTPKDAHKDKHNITKIEYLK